MEVLMMLVSHKRELKIIIRWKLVQTYREGRENKSRLLLELLYSFVMWGCWKGNCEATRKCWRMQSSSGGLAMVCGMRMEVAWLPPRARPRLVLETGQTGCDGGHQPHCISRISWPRLPASTRPPPPPAPELHEPQIDISVIANIRYQKSSLS